KTMSKILTRSDVLKIIAPADPDNIAQYQQAVFGARWVDVDVVPEDELITMRSNPRLVIKHDAPTTKEKDGYNGYEIRFEVLPEKKDWILVWLKLGKQNAWIKPAGDPPFDKDSFRECETIDELVENLGRSNWSVGV